MGEFSRVLGLPAEQTNGAAVPDAVDVLARAAGVVGADRVSHTTGLGPNVSRYRSRRVGGVVRPETVAQVRELVRLFGSVPGAGLHAVSTGRNWGLGSREPTADDVVVLDLGDLAQVREVDLTGGWAVVEPGVTQG
ncbi:MAG TPA: FAD-binding protein, partial [Nocardioidaceae bacterium]|nr:FAD-binding protein [Nocardioidaceae bacterium]